jgi:hypothetical protein
LKPLDQARFEALAGYIRRPEGRLFAQELEFCSDDAARVLGVLVRDLTDNDFGGVVLGRDTRRRFRAVTVGDFCETKDAAREFLR